MPYRAGTFLADLKKLDFRKYSTRDLVDLHIYSIRHLLIQNKNRKQIGLFDDDKLADQCSTERRRQETDISFIVFCLTFVTLSALFSQQEKKRTEHTQGD